MLLLCFTDGLGQWLASHLADTGIEARSISQLALELCREQGIEMDSRNPDRWEEANLHASEAVQTAASRCRSVHD